MIFEKKLFVFSLKFWGWHYGIREIGSTLVALLDQENLEYEVEI